MSDEIGKVIKQKRDLKKKLGEVCVYCGCTNNFLLNIDHKVPLSRGGKDVDSNKQVTCILCNSLKDSLSHQEFKKYLKGLSLMYDIGKIYVHVNDFSVHFNARGYLSESPSPNINSNNRKEKNKERKRDRKEDRKIIKESLMQELKGPPQKKVNNPQQGSKKEDEKQKS